MSHREGPEWQTPGAGPQAAAEGRARGRLLPPGWACTLGVSHLPVGDVHSAVVPPGQREGDSVASCKHARDAGLHHLWGAKLMGGTGTPRGPPPPHRQLAHLPQRPHLVDGEKPGVQTDATLPQETRGRHSAWQDRPCVHSSPAQPMPSQPVPSACTPRDPVCLPSGLRYPSEKVSVEAPGGGGHPHLSPARATSSQLEQGPS